MATANIDKNKCARCGKPIALNPNTQSAVHVGGGEMVQKCLNGSCGWSGSQIQKFTKCPQCGDGTQLVDDHVATI